MPAVAPIATDGAPPASATVGPPVWSAAEQAWLVMRHADVAAVLRSSDFRTADPAASVRDVLRRTGERADHLVAVLEGAAIFQGGDRHRAVRAELKRFVAAVAARWPEAAIDALAQRTLAPLRAGTTVDFMPAVCDAVPNAVAASALGLRIDEVEWLRDLALQLSAAWRPLVPLREIRRLDEIAKTVRTFLVDRIGDAAAVATIADTAGLSATDLTLFMVTAVVETSSAALGNAVDLLARRADIQRRLRDEPSLVPAFVDEALRLAGSTYRLNRRIALRDVELGGVAIGAGAPVILVIEAAHRDPDVYDAPDDVDLARAGPPLFAFGGGAHACLGPHIATLELVATVRRLVERFELAPADEPARRRQSKDFRQFESLPIRLY